MTSFKSAKNSLESCADRNCPKIQANHKFGYGILLAGLLMASFAPALNAQFGQQQGSSQSSICSDPLMAGSSLCSSQSQLSVGSVGAGGGFSAPTSGSLPSIQQPQSEVYSDITPYNSPQVIKYLQPVPPAPPEPLTEFQRFVASTSGSVLPVFGSKLFRNGPSTFIPTQSAPVPNDFVIGPDDEIRIRVWGQISFQANLRVDRSGDIYIPKVGTIHVAGLEFGQLDGQLRTAISRIYRNFDLNVNMGQIRSIQIYLAGQARMPGSYTVSSLSTLIDALFSTGGPSSQGSLRHIELRRNNTVVTDLDLYSLIIRGDKSGDAKLLPGDVIYIRPIGPQVAITGSVRTPAIYELRENETVGDLIRDAGGLTAVASATRLSLERIDNHRERLAMNIAYDDAGLATHLADGDLLNINSIVPAYQNTVTLRGNVANPGRFAWHPGMRISELIPDKQSLLTRDYWWKRASLGLSAPEFQPFYADPSLHQPDQTTPALHMGGQANTANLTTPQGSTAATAQPEGVTPTGPGQSLSTAAAMEGSSTSNRYQASTLGSSTQPQAPTARAGNRIDLVAPEIDWDYAAIERQNTSTLKSEIIPFDLGKLVVQGDQSQNVELQPGDVITIFSEADIHLPLAQQTKMVRLEGEFAHSGAYTALPGETLRQLIQRAGGLTPGAYLYGSQFTRESTRILQQQRIDQYVQTLQLQMERGNLALAAAGAGSPTQLAVTGAAQSSERDIISRLQQFRATGRVVLGFKPNAEGLQVIPDIPLEDGDAFIVPPLPATVNVVGAVNTQNSFLFNRSRRVGDYLRLAGGPTRSADARHSFVIRADGEVVSRENVDSVWNNAFASLHLNPGDTVVVPDKIVQPSVIRGILDWSQGFAQLAFGAAAIHTVF